MFFVYGCSDGACEHDEDYRDWPEAAPLPPGQRQHPLQPHPAAEGGSPRPGTVLYCTVLHCTVLYCNVQEAVNHYISELAIEKKNNHKLSAKERKHLVMLEVGSAMTSESVSNVL